MMHDFKIVYLLDSFSLLPAHAGVILAARRFSAAASASPRTRGGDPGTYNASTNKVAFSPHPRG